MAGNLGFTTRIEIPQGNTGVYEAAGEDAVRMTGTWFTGAPLPANWGTALGTLTAAGEPLMRLARLPATETPLTDLIEAYREGTRRLLSTWERRLSAMLEDDETVAAQAIVPAWATETPLLLAVTDQRVLQFRADDRQPNIFPLSHITSADLSHSVMQSWLRLWVAGDGGVERVQVDFPLVTLGAFTRAYLAIRRALIAPAAFQVNRREMVTA